MSGAMRKIVVLIGSLSLLALPLVASADEGEEDPAPPDDSQLVYHYDSNAQVLLFGFFSPETDPKACSPVEPVTEGTSDDGGSTDDGGATTDDAVGEATPVLPEGCTELAIDGSLGKVNHGSFLSLFTKEFKASFEGDTPFGHYVREFAKSHLGKTDKSGKAEKADKGSDDEDGSETDDDDGGPGKPDKTSNGNNGNGHGKGNKGD